jgi:hypothetical protein
MKTISNLLAALILGLGFGLSAPVAADGCAFWDFNSPVPDANPITGTTVTDSNATEGANFYRVQVNKP